MGLNSAAVSFYMLFFINVNYSQFLQKVTQIMKNQIEPREKNEKIQIFISKILPL
jgi:hypothetical protein